MSDESKTEFQLWAETEFINGPLQYHGMYLGWHARDAEVAALKARVGELEKQLTVTDDRDRTHSAECWKWHRHHACAIARAERLEAQIAALQTRLPGDER